MAHSSSDSAAPTKAVDPETGVSSTLAEPVSGHNAEMSGALPTLSKGPAAPDSATAKPTSTGASNANGVDIATGADSASEPHGNNDTEMNDAPNDESALLPEANGIAAEKRGAGSKRKSVGAIPEHKSKKLNKKKSMPKITQLDAKPGDYFFARLKSYPPWPSIICDEDMLPTSLLTTRPITTKQADGTYKEAYADGGKKVMDRTYPVMFLYTNEFAWIPNTDLTPLDPVECKDPVAKSKTKSLLAAYEVAAEGHSLAYFKDMLADHANALQEEADRVAAREAEKAEKAAEKAEKKKSRKSEVKASKEDVEMADADGESKKASKKRKKGADDEDEQTEKPPKTPKTTKIKLTTNKTPATSEKKTKEPKSAKPKSEKKRKAAAGADLAETVEEESKPLDPVEERKAREKEVLFLRHKLQKGFISREDSPREDEMPQMSNYIKKLEAYPELEVAIIRATKINKVLKALVKLNTIPRDEEFQFRKRSVDLLSKWNKILGAEPAETANGDKDKVGPTTNGVHEKKEQAGDKSAGEKKSEPPASEESKAAPVPAVSTAAKEPSAPADSTDQAAVSNPRPAEPAQAIEKAPESAAAAAVVQNVVKDME